MGNSDKQIMVMLVAIIVSLFFCFIILIFVIRSLDDRRFERRVEIYQQCLKDKQERIPSITCMHP